jgi:hypothetical protein
MTCLAAGMAIRPLIAKTMRLPSRIYGGLRVEWASLADIVALPRLVVPSAAAGRLRFIGTK